MIASFWSDPRLQWPGSAVEMRDAMLFHVPTAPNEAALGRIIDMNVELYFRMPESDRHAIEDAIFARRQELRGERNGTA